MVTKKHHMKFSLVFFQTGDVFHTFAVFHFDLGLSLFWLLGLLKTDR